jgi:hypothetical protein
VGLTDVLVLLKDWGPWVLFGLAMFFGELVPRRPYVKNLEADRDFWRASAEHSADALKDTTAQLAMANQLVAELRSLAYTRAGYPYPPDEHGRRASGGNIPGLAAPPGEEGR